MIMYCITLMMTIVLLSTMILSTLYSKPPQREKEEKIIDKNLHTVGAGNFSYWRLSYDGSLIIELYTMAGDADIYISESLMPSYEVDKNNLSSATCGVDSVIVPSDFPRPFTLAVFGHWSHSSSDYKLAIHQPDSLKLHILPQQHPLVLHNVKPEFAELIVHHLLVDSPTGKKKEEEIPEPGFFRSWIVHFISVIVELFVL